MIITEEIVRRVGAEIPFIGDPYDAQPIQLGGLTVFRTQAVALVVGAVLITRSSWPSATPAGAWRCAPRRRTARRRR